MDRRIIALVVVGAAVAARPSVFAQAPEFHAPWIGYDTSVYPNSIDSWGVRQADFDGDGNVDLAVSGWYANPKLSILFGDGHGRFAAPVQYALTFGALDLEVADFDRDGDIDIVVSNTGQTWDGTSVALFRNQGNGAFVFGGTFAAGPGPTGITTADFNGDGWPDVAVAHDAYIASGHSFAVLLNDKAGGFLAPTIVNTQSGTHSIAAGDLDGDGDADLVLALESNQIVVSMNQGGSFGAGTAYVGAQAMPITQSPCVKLVDVDGDGDLDILYSNSGSGSSTSGTLALFRNPGSGVFGAAQPISLGPLSQGAVGIAAADVTGDGVIDLLAATQNAEMWCLVPGDGNGGFLPARQMRAGEDPIALEIADLDHDGKLDVVSIGSGSLEACVHLNPGAGAFAIPPVIDMSDPSIAPTSYSNLVAGDVDQDGDLDLVVGWSDNFGSGFGIDVRRNDGHGNFAPRENYPTPALPIALKLCDLNGDGRLDLLWLDDAATPRFRWKLNQGNGTFGNTSTYSTGFCGNGGDLEAADVNGDGKLDVLVIECDSSVFVALNNGVGFTPGITHTLSNSASTLAVGDFDGDGDIDIATNSGVQGFVEVSLGDGHGSFAAPHWFQGGRAVSAIAARDVDGDGVLDLCTAFTLDGGGLSVLIGRGDGSFKPGVQYHGSHSSTWDNVRSIALGDVDRDGDLDVAIANYGSQDVSYWRNHGNGTFDPQIRLGVSNKAWDVELADFDGDGALDLAALVEPLATNGWYYPGVTILGGTFGPGWTSYCTAKLNSSGCSPSIHASGAPSASAGSGFAITAANVLNNKSGLFFYSSNGQQAAPFQGGTLCVKLPLKRTALQSSNGNPPPNDCSGSYSIDFNAYVASGVDPALVAGSTIDGQYWARDPGFSAPNNTSLSNALHVTLSP